MTVLSKYFTIRPLRSVFWVTVLTIAGAGQGMVLAASLEMTRLSDKLYAEANTAIAAKNLDNADSLLTQSLIANPANAAAFILKGHIAGLQDNPEEARRLIDLGLNIDPGNLQAVLWAGEAALAMDDMEDADIRLSRLQKLCGDCAEYRQLQSALEADNGAFNNAAAGKDEGGNKNVAKADENSADKTATSD